VFFHIFDVADWLKVFKAVVVPEELKEATQAAMLPPASCHVYSIQNCTVKVSTSELQQIG